MLNEKSRAAIERIRSTFDLIRATFHDGGSRDAFSSVSRGETMVCSLAHAIRDLEEGFGQWITEPPPVSQSLVFAVQDRGIVSLLPGSSDGMNAYSNDGTTIQENCGIGGVHFPLLGWMEAPKPVDLDAIRRQLADAGH